MALMRNARQAISLACLGLLLGITSPADAMKRDTPVSELVIDAGSGRTLFTTEADRVRPPASLAKMMTLLIAFEAIDAGHLHMNASVAMTALGARQPPSRLGLAAGDRINVGVAIRAIAVISANDLAVALAERLAGSEAAFVTQMNRRASQLGMTRTRFGNATGLAPGGGTSTAHDMSLLARWLAKRSDRYRIFSLRAIRWRGQVRSNHNRLLGRVPGVDGIKTGYTVPAGFNLAASARRNGRRVIVVVLGAKTAAARDLLVANLLEAGFTSTAGRIRRTPS